MLTIQVMNHFVTWFAVKISPGKQDKYHYLVAIKTTSLKPKENEGTEREAPSPGLGIRQFHLSYFRVAGNNRSAFFR